VKKPIIIDLTQDDDEALPDAYCFNYSVTQQATPSEDFFDFNAPPKQNEGE